MTYAPLVLQIIISFILSATILYRYGNWFRHHIAVTLIVLIAWFFSFLIIFALPLDIISTVYRQCNSTVTNSTGPCGRPWNEVPDDVFPGLWRTVYWSMQFLTWLVMPMMQMYIKAGDFTVKGKLKSAVIANAIYYGSYLLICTVLLIYLAVKPGVNLDWPKLKAIASSASNTWGLFLLVLLFGYAFVEVPRRLWHNSNRGYMLTHCYFKAAKLCSDKCEAEETVDDVLEMLQAVSLAVGQGHYLYPCFETIMMKVPAELKDRMMRRQLPDDTPTDVPSEGALVRLHKRTIKSLQTLQRTETQWGIMIEKIFDLEDTLKNQISRDRRFKRTFQKPQTWFNQYLYTPTVEWYWKCLIYGYMQKCLAIIAGIFSIAVVWSELTFFNKQPVLSIFAVFVNLAKASYDYTMIQMMSTVIILYLCYCAYSTVLKIKVLNLYYLAPHHQTNEYSLIFSGMMLSRLTPPLCLNFLGLIHMDSHIIKTQVLETHYTQIMGHMDVIAIISDGFNVYFPMAILVFCLASYFSIGSRLLSFVGFHQFKGDDEMTTDLVEEGQELIKREKRKRQRSEDTSTRRRDFDERFSTNGRHRSTDSVRPMTQMQPIENNTRLNLLEGGRPMEVRYTSEVDTRFPPVGEDDIDARFGISTRINERYDSGQEFEPRFTDGGYQDQYRRVGVPPKGIFDDV